MNFDNLNSFTNGLSNYRIRDNFDKSDAENKPKDEAFTNSLFDKPLTEAKAAQKVTAQPTKPAPPAASAPQKTTSVVTPTGQTFSYTPGTTITTNTGNYKITTAKDNQSPTGYSFFATKYDKDGSKLADYKVAKTNDVTYQYFGMGKKEEAHRSNEKIVFLQPVGSTQESSQNVSVTNDYKLWSIINALAGEKDNKTSVKPAKNEFVDGDHSQFSVTENDSGKLVLINPRGYTRPLPKLGEITDYTIQGK